MPDWALRRRRLMGDQSVPAAPAVDQFSSEVDLAAAAELPVLRALLQIAKAVTRASYFDEALEAIAEQSLIALNAASASISRWEPEHNSVRTLINVGDLAAGEERWPDRELYSVDGDLPMIGLLRQGLPYVIAIDDVGVDPAEVAWLREIGKESELAVPVMYGDRIWGELWVTGNGGRRFGADDVQLLQGIAAYAAMAIGRSELLSTVWRFAHQDPLTGLPNRRELERIFHEMDWQTACPALLVCDLDRFKEINDQHGHPAGDELLRKVATVLGDAASSRSEAIAARLGGDEFCVLLPRSSLDEAEQFARDVSRDVQRMIGTDVTLSWGATVAGPHATSGQALIAAADSALLEAKSLGPGRFSVGVSSRRTDRGVANHRNDIAGPARSAADRLVPRVVQVLDAAGPQGPADALEILAGEINRVIDVAAWSLSETTEDGAHVRTIRGVDSERDPVARLAFLRKVDSGTVYPLADYPSTARALARCETFLAAADLDGSDAAEVELLNQWGYSAVLAVGAAAADRGYLLEIYSSTGHQQLADLASHLQVLAHYCVTRYR